MDLYPIKQSKLETRSLILSPLILTQKMMMWLSVLMDLHIWLYLD